MVAIYNQASPVLLLQLCHAGRLGHVCDMARVGLKNRRCRPLLKRGP
jgi:hypothetical protein